MTVAGMDRGQGQTRAQKRQAWLERIDSALRAYGMAAAGELAGQAVAEGVEHPAVFNLAASAAHEAGRLRDAVALLERARRLAPRDPHVLNTLGICLAELGQSGPALKAYDAAIRAEPTLAAVHYNRAVLLEGNNQLVAARKSYQRSSALDPDYLEPVAGLAWLDALAGNRSAAREAAARVLQRAPSNILAQMALASVDLQSGALDDAAGRLDRLDQNPRLSAVNRAIVAGMIGDLRDAQGSAGEAFAAYEACNRQLQELYRGQFDTEANETPAQLVRRLAAWFSHADAAKWEEAPPVRPRAGDPKTHVFLVGFPRSGTTLLENVLAAHSEVVTLEEKDCLAEIAGPYLSSTQGLERLQQLSGGEAARDRNAYWTAVRACGVEPRGKVFIDKMPLSSISLPVIAKLFPDARILFAQRDPRDVVLSCFRRRFGMNASMYQLLTLNGAADFYDGVMDLASIYLKMLPLATHVVRYESLVDDFRGTVANACDFLGLDWQNAMTGFAAGAASRGISTPSAPQVARGLNREGAGAWRRYAEQMEAVWPTLRPWVERFGYPA